MDNLQSNLLNITDIENFVLELKQIGFEKVVLTDKSNQNYKDIVYNINVAKKLLYVTLIHYLNDNITITVNIYHDLYEDNMYSFSCIVDENSLKFGKINYNIGSGYKTNQMNDTLIKIKNFIKQNK